MVASSEHCGCIPWYAIKRLKDAGRTKFLDELVELIKNSSSSSSGRKKRSWDNQNDNVNFTEFYGPKDAKEMMKYGSYDEYFTKGLKYSKYMCDSYSLAKCNNKFPKFWQDEQKKFTTICQDPCAFNHYDIVVTSTKFPPSEKYFNGYLKKNNGQEYTWDYAKDNLIRLHVYYDKMEYRQIDQTKDYEIQNFIGELGGTVDLFIGFSFFTVFQLLEIVVACIYVRCRKKGKSDDPKIENGPDNVKMNNI
jgi:WD40 repeat protein